MTSCRPILLVFATSVLMAAPLMASAAEPAKEVATAVTHAGLAAGSPSIEMVRTHLHHVINCLVGPAGADFSAADANPCKDQGAGAIPDSAADKQADLKASLMLAKEGLILTDFEKAKAQASSVQNALKKASM